HLGDIHEPSLHARDAVADRADRELGAPRALPVADAIPVPGVEQGALEQAPSVRCAARTRTSLFDVVGERRAGSEAVEVRAPVPPLEVGPRDAHAPRDRQAGVAAADGVLTAD